MSDCTHTALHVEAQVFTVPSESADFTIRAAHVKVRCRECGMPFRFMGEIRPAPSDPLDFMRGGAPWASAERDELASWIAPIEATPILANMTPEGQA